MHFNPIFIISFLSALTILFILVGVYKWLTWTRQIDERFEMSVQSSNYGGWGGPGLSRSKEMEQRLIKTPYFNDLRLQLAQGGTHLTVYEYLAIRFGLTIACLVAGWLIAHNPIGGILLAIAGWIGPGMYLRHRREGRRKLFEAQLPDVLNLLVSSLQAGYGLQQALNIIVKEMPEPSAGEFSRVLKEMQLGYSLDDALDHLVERVHSDDLALIVTAIHIQNEVGGSLAEVIQNISETILERIRINGEIQTLTAEQRMSGTVLTALPFLLGTVFMLINPEYMMGMFQPGWPLLIPIVATIMTITGYFIMRQMLKLDY
ncbi:MAG: hypothetical protein GXP38_04350 [Chloroflexi bacterium]|nr:hypothetical protein [Chloroflexota bacterium]